MAHSTILTEDEFAQLSKILNYEVVRYLEYCRSQFGLSKEEIKVFDWGCGRGIWLARLLELGYTNVRGVEIDPEVTERGRSFYAGRGYDIDQYCSSLNNFGKCDYPDDSFHFVFSTQVFEHVSDLPGVASEISRITMDGGMGLHIFPAHHRLPVEGHLFMPMVHWLPKNRGREKLIRFFTSVGIEPNWPPLEGKKWQERADIYYRFSVEETFYRTTNEVITILGENGLDAKPVSIEHPLFTGENARLGFMRTGPMKAVTNWMLLNFKTVEILTRKPA